MEQCLEVLGYATSAQSLFHSIHVRGQGHLLAGQHLHQVCAAEVAESAQFTHFAQHLDIDDVLGGEQAVTTGTEGCHSDFVGLVVSGLHNHLHSVAQGVDLGVELSLLGLLYLACLW